MKTVPLTTPITMFGKTISEIRLKEPNGALFIRLGEPRTGVFNASGSGYWVEQPQTIQAYLDVLIENEGGGGVLGHLTLEDGIALKEALFSFFTEAAERRSARK